MPSAVLDSPEQICAIPQRLVASHCFVFPIIPMTHVDDTTEDAAEKTAKPAPATRIHDKGVFLSIFTRTIRREDGTDFTLYNTAIERRFRDENGEFQSSYSYSEEQLAVLADLVHEARDYIRQSRKRQRAEEH